MFRSFGPPHWILIASAIFLFNMKIHKNELLKTIPKNYLTTKRTTTIPRGAEDYDHPKGCI